MREANGGAFRDLQVDIALQVNRAGQELALGYEDMSAAGRVAGSDRLLKCFRTIPVTVANCAETSDHELAIGKNRRLDSRQDARNFIPCSFGRGPSRGQGRHGSRQHWRGCPSEYQRLNEFPTIVHHVSIAWWSSLEDKPHANLQLPRAVGLRRNRAETCAAGYRHIGCSKSRVI